MTGRVGWVQHSLLAAVVLLGVGCSGPVKTSDRSIQPIDEHRLRQMLAKTGDQPVVLVDVRPVGRFEQGHIPGALNIPLPLLVGDDPRLIGARAIVVYASGWTDGLSPAAAKRLMTLGYEHVYDFRGGLEVWVKGEDADRPGHNHSGW